MAASMGSLLLAAGTKGKRYVLPHARVMIHQPHIMGNGIAGQVSDIEIQAREMINTKRRLTEIYVKHTGQPFEKLTEAMDRDNYLSAEDARDFGLVDMVVKDRKLTKSQG
jgi:ATP-dependent Clp protease protease subunit